MADSWCGRKYLANVIYKNNSFCPFGNSGEEKLPFYMPSAHTSYDEQREKRRALRIKKQSLGRLVSQADVEQEYISLDQVASKRTA